MLLPVLDPRASQPKLVKYFRKASSEERSHGRTHNLLAIQGVFHTHVALFQLAEGAGSAVAPDT